MAEHCGYVVKVDQLRKHSNADRLQIATFFGSDTIVSLDTQLGDVGIYFPVGLQLSEAYCTANDLVRRKDENGKQCGGYLDPVKRNITAIKLRGEKSDGVFMPLKSLASFGDIDLLNIGDKIEIFNGQQICEKYIPKHSSNGYRGGGGTNKRKVNFECPTFYEHVETEQLVHNMDAFKVGDTVEITLKMHGTSQRQGYLPVTREVKRKWWEKLLRRPVKTKTEYEYVVGTRRVVMNDHTKGGYYDSDEWRYAMAAKFEGKLHKGETVYYEVVGFQGPNGAPIMGSVANSKIKDKEFSAQYGDMTVFSYGCDQSGSYIEEFADDCSDGAIVKINPCCKPYVYRMTMVNEDGDVVEYTPDYMRYRCEQMGVQTVMKFEQFTIPDCDNPGEYVKEKCELYYDGPDPVGKTHVREGVVARILNRPTFTAFKHKNFNFKVLSGIIADQADTSNMSEDQLAEL